jgi:YHS domain-containing protein
MILFMALMFASTIAFTQTQGAGKADSQKMPKAGCMADSMKKACGMDKAKMSQGCCMNDSLKKACGMNQAKMDSCRKMMGEGVKCACQKAGKKCDGSCKKEGKPCDAKADSMKKAHGMHMSKVKEEGKAAIEQKTCPVMGGPIDKSVYIDYQGKRIYFCCDSCKAKFLKSPETYLKKKK